MTVPASGGTPTRITKLQAGEAVHVWPQMLPGGRAALFTSNASLDDSFNDAKIEAVTLKDGRRKIIQQGGTYGRYVPAARGPGHLIYVHESTLFAVAFDPDKLEETRGTGRRGAEHRDRYRGRGTAGFRTRWTAHIPFRYPAAPIPAALMVGAVRHARAAPALKPDDYRFVRLSPDGQKIGLTVSRTGGIDLLVYDWKRDVTTRLTFDGKSRAGTGVESRRTLYRVRGRRRDFVDASRWRRKAAVAARGQRR